MRAVALAALLVAGPCLGQARPARPAPPPATVPSAQPLTLGEVLASSARAAPQIVEALARVRQAQGRALSAEGAFDTVFNVEGQSRLLGYYNGSVVEGRATRPLTDNGGYVYGNYRLSSGTFPIYEDQAFTNRLGEAKVGALYSLLRDRLIDERRARRTIAAADIDVARFETEATAIGVQARAIGAYQQWVAAGLRLVAYRDLLALAEQRRGVIARQVQLGGQPRILLTENDTNLVRRQGLVVRSEQEFAAAANALSLYLRDEEGRPITVGADRLPPDATGLQGLATIQANGPVLRPDLDAILARIDQSLVRLALAENDLKPRLDLRGELGKDVGPEGPGGFTRTPTEAIVGFRFSVPLQNRAAKGRVAEARAEIDALRARTGFIRDQIAIEVEGVRIAVDAAERLVDAANQERRLAEELAEAERRRFALGTSSFFLVNQREEAANDARLRLVDAQARLAAARADLAAATADRAALGLPARP